MEWEEYIMLLIAARHVFSHREEVMYMILAVMSLQWHFIGRIDDIMCLITTTVQQNPRHPFAFNGKCASQKIFDPSETCQRKYFLRRWIH